MDQRQHRTGSEAIAHGFGVWAALKTALVGYEAAKRAADRGVPVNEAIIIGATAALAWQLMFAWTIFYFISVSSILVRPLLYLDTIQHTETDHSMLYVWTVTTVFGGAALVIGIAVWLIFWHRCIDKLAGKHGRLYRWGFRLDRRFTLRRKWWTLALIATLAPIPLYGLTI